MNVEIIIDGPDERLMETRERERQITLLILRANGFPFCSRVDVKVEKEEEIVE